MDEHRHYGHHPAPADTEPPAEPGYPHHPEVADPAGALPGIPRVRHNAHAEHDGHAGHDKHAGHSVEMFRRKFWLTLALTIPTVVWGLMLMSLTGWHAPAFPGSPGFPGSPVAPVGS